jgi:hypothetical protein
MNIILLIIILILFIYKITGLYFIFPFIICLINIIITSDKIYINPDDIIYRIINFFYLLGQIFIIIVINVIILFELIIPVL